MNVDYFIKKQHIFKKRKFYYPTYIRNLYWGSAAYLSMVQQRFDFVYLRTFKKLFKRKFFKSRIAFYKPKYWLCLDINIILSAKSKNSRMGAGVGNFVRLSMQLIPKKTLIEFKWYEFTFLKKVVKYLYHKCSLQVLLVKRY